MRANRLYGGRLTRGCVGYLAHCLALLVTLGVGLGMAIYSGYGSAAFPFWISLFTFAVGGFVPAPDLKPDAEDNDPLAHLPSNFGGRALPSP